MQPKDSFKEVITPDPDYVFVLLREESKEIYEKCIKKAVESINLKCDSYLDLQTPGEILPAIWEGVKRAQIIICDISEFNPNVMYELGIASVVKDHVIIICDEEKLKGHQTLPFNIYQLRVHFYDKAKPDKLHGKLIKVIQEIQKRVSGFIDDPIRNIEVKKYLEDAKTAKEERNWRMALLAFEKMNELEPNNWFVYNQWGVIYREKGDLETANKKFREALNLAEFEEQKSYVYTEIAVLNAKDKKMNEALSWFERAEKAYKTNRELYIAWAKFYEEMERFRNAQNKINYVLTEIDPDDQECKLRYDYYHNKINISNFKDSFDEFVSKRRGPIDGPAPEPLTIPWPTTLDVVKKEYVGKIVYGTIKNITKELGIFVDLAQNVTGLIFKANLDFGYEKRFAKNQRIKVRINTISVHYRTGKDRIDLRLA